MCFLFFGNFQEIEDRNGLTIVHRKSMVNLSLLKGCGDIFLFKMKEKKKIEEARGGCKLKLYPFIYFLFFFNLMKDKRSGSFWVVNCRSRGGKKKTVLFY